MKLIDKIRAEVEKKTHGEQGYSSGDAECGYRDCARDILSFLNTLEEKYVDLEKEIEEVKHNYKVDDNRHTSICSADIEWLAEHFFELGMQQLKKDNKQ